MQYCILKVTLLTQLVCRWILLHTMNHVCLIHVPVTLEETVNVSALQLLPMLSPVIKLASVSNGEPPRSVVSIQDENVLSQTALGCT